MAEVNEGSIASCITRLEGDADAWALGSTGAWFSAIVERDARRLELGGEYPPCGTGFALSVLLLPAHRVSRS